jgi:hypothetical protein
MVRWYKDIPFEYLKRVDWGVDLFTLGTALNDFTKFLELKRHEDCQSNEKAHKYLCELPMLLRSFNQLTDGINPRPNLPHREICADIDALEKECRKWGNPSWNYDWNKYLIIHSFAKSSDHKIPELPERFMSGTRAAPSTLVDPPPNKSLVSGTTLTQSGAWYPTTVSIPSLGLEVGKDPVTKFEFSFPDQLKLCGLPVVSITLEQIQDYLNKLNHRAGLPKAKLAQTCEPNFRKKYIGFRLLCLEEWIKVCQGDLDKQPKKIKNDSPYAYVIDDEWLTAGELRPKHAVYKWDDGESRAHCLLPSERPKGPLAVDHSSNRFNCIGGVRGMHGNVWEIVTTNNEGEYRKCGGAWDSSPDRLGFDVMAPVVTPGSLPHGSVGFRICRTRVRA